MESHGMDLDMLGSAVASSGMTVSEIFDGERKFFIVHRHPHSIVLVHLQKKLSYRITQPLYWIVLFARGWTIQMIQIIYAYNCVTQLLLIGWIIHMIHIV